MRKIILLMLSLIMSSFMGPFMNGDRLQTLVFKDVDRALEKFSNRYEMVVYGAGGAFCEDVEKIMLSVSVYKSVGVEEARRIYVEILDVIINQINQNSKIRPYLRDYPMDDKPIELSLRFEDKKQQRPSKEYIAYVFTIPSGKIIYNIFENNKLETIHEEPLKEAFQIVHQEKIRKL